MAHPSIQAGGCHGVLADMAACRICRAKQIRQEGAKTLGSPKSDFGHQSGRHWPELEGTPAFETCSRGGKPVGPIPGPPRGPRHDEKNTEHVLEQSLFVQPLRTPPHARHSIGHALAILVPPSWCHPLRLSKYAHVACAGNSRSLTFLCFYCDLL